MLLRDRETSRFAAAEADCAVLSSEVRKTQALSKELEDKFPDEVDNNNDVAA